MYYLKIYFCCFFLILSLIKTSSALEKKVLKIYTYDSFVSEWGPGPKLEKEFEKNCNCDLKFVGLDSSVGILGRIQIEGNKTDADIALGLDNNLLSTAKKTNLFIEHNLDVNSNGIPINFNDNIFVPFDWGYFAFVYDQNKLKKPPTSFEQIINSKDDFKIVIQDPRTSTPGLGLLLWIKSIYGDKASNVWEELQPKILTVTKSWWDAYSLFLDGEADMVLSYSTSPAYHKIAEEKNNYAASSFKDGHYMQIEVAAITKNSKNKKLAKEFLKFINSKKAQSIIPTTNWMYPVIKSEIPEEFSYLIKPSKNLLFSSDTVSENQKIWIKEWLNASSK